MKGNRSIFNYIFSKVVIIQLSGLLILFFIVFIFLLGSVKRLDDSTEKNIAECILSAISSTYSAIEHFEMGFQRKLETVLKESKNLDYLIGFIEASRNFPFEDLEYRIISENDIKDLAIKEKVSNLSTNVLKAKIVYYLLLQHTA